MRKVLRLLGGAMLAGLLALPTTSEEAEQPGLIHSPWIKTCFEEGCSIGSGIRLERGGGVGASLIERAGEMKKSLVVSVPPAWMSKDLRVRIIIDQGRPIIRPFSICFPNGCMADYQGGNELVEQFKQGQILFLEVTDAANSLVNLSLPLIGFTEAYDGPPQ